MTRRCLLSLALATLGCSATSATPGGASDAATPAGGDAAGPDLDAGAEAEAAASCRLTGGQLPDSGTCVIEATGTVQDLAGNRLPNLMMTMCSPTLCFGSHADDAGAYTIPVGHFILPQNYAVHADGRPDNAVDYFRLGPTEPSIITVDMHLPTLPPSTVLLPADGAPASSVTVGDLTLQIPSATKWALDLEDFAHGVRTLRVVAVPLASAPPYAAANKVDAIYALAPSGAKPSQKVGVSLRNSAGLAASAGVDLLVLSDDYFTNPPAVGTLVLSAAAHVSADGSTIQTDPGEGISEITWLAVRQKGK